MTICPTTDVSADEPTVAVMRFETYSPSLEKHLNQLTTKLGSRLSMSGKFCVIPYDEVREEQQRLSSELKTGDYVNVAPLLGKSLYADWVFLPCAAYEDGFFSVSVTAINIIAPEYPNGHILDAHGAIDDLYETTGQLADLAAADSAYHTNGGTSSLALNLLGALFSIDTAPQPRRREMCALELQCMVEQLHALAVEFDEAISKKNNKAARSCINRFQEISAGHPVLDEWRKQLGTLRKAWEAFAPMSTEQAQLVQSAAAEQFKLDSILKFDLGNEIIMELALIPAGDFVMGSPDDEEGRENDEGPQFESHIERPFYMGKHEVTQSEWRAVMGNGPSSNLPVGDVSWNDCRDFCRKLSSRTRREVCLPTEAQWEYACRAGTTTPFHFGTTISTEQANYDGRAIYGKGRKGKHRFDFTEVGSFLPNAWGLYDMHGNAFEWCDEVYRNYNGRPLDGSWTGVKWPVLRGGSFNYEPQCSRAASRYKNPADSRIDFWGFRVTVVATTTP